jgi:hypothetical protein
MKSLSLWSGGLFVTRMPAGLTLAIISRALTTSLLSQRDQAVTQWMSLVSVVLGRRKIRRKLGDYGQLWAVDVPPKPRGMWRRTYVRHCGALSGLTERHPIATPLPEPIRP